jgi:hypothetical protein
MHVYEVRPRKDHRGVDLIFRCIAIRPGFGYGEPNAISNAVSYAKFFSRSHHAVIRVYDYAGNVIETEELPGAGSKPFGGLVAGSVTKFDEPSA